MHALDWIAQHGRFLRTLGAARLRKNLGRAKGRCTWCDGELGGAQRCWCSAACLDAFKDRCWPTRITRKLKRRDKGVCALCGIDTQEAEELLDKIKVNVGAGCLQHHENYHLRSKLIDAMGAAPKWAKTAQRARHWKKVAALCCCIACLTRREHPPGWEADHVTPVIEGGGLCGPDGYRTLCIVCHRRETAALAKRLAAKRRGECVVTLAEHP